MVRWCPGLYLRRTWVHLVLLSELEYLAVPITLLAWDCSVGVSLHWRVTLVVQPPLLILRQSL